MNKRTGLLIAIVALISLSLGAQTNGRQLSPIEQKARAAQGGDDSRVRDLVDEVFRAHGLQSGPPGLLDEAKNRLTRAEIDYRKGQHKSITEDDVVKAVNNQAKKYNAPDYAFISKYEVRRVRVGAFAEAPHLISQDRTPRKEAPKSFNPEMSPVEAFHVAATLVHQKLVNPDYQLTSAERRARWSQDHRKHSPRALSSDRTNELHSLVRRHTAQMSLEDGQAEAGECLDLLGVER